MDELITTVHVRDAAGENHVFGPGDDLPEWAATAITNPAVFAKSQMKDVPVDPPVKKPRPRKRAATKTDG